MVGRLQLLNIENYPHSMGRLSRNSFRVATLMVNSCLGSREIVQNARSSEARCVLPAQQFWPSATPVPELTSPGNKMVMRADFVTQGTILPLSLRRSTLTFGRALNTAVGLPSLDADIFHGEVLENGTGHRDSDLPSAVRSANKCLIESPEFINILSILRDGPWGHATESALQGFAERVTRNLVVEVVKRQKAELALRFFQWAKRQAGYSHGTDTYNAMIQNLARAQKFEIALELLKEMKTEGFSVNSRTFTPLIVRYGKAAMVKEALTLLSSIKAFDFQPDGRIFSCYRTLFFKNRHLLPSPEDILAHVAPADKEAFDFVIDCLGRAGKIDDAREILNVMEGRGFKPDTHTYGILVDCICREGEAGKAGELITLLRDKGLQLDASIYNPLIYYYCRHANIEKFLEAFEQMKRDGGNPDTITCNVLLIGFFKAGEFNRALSQYRMMLAEGPAPNEHTYGILFQGLREGIYSDYDKLYGFFNDALNLGVKIHIQLINFVLKRLCNYRKLEEADSLFRRLSGVTMPNNDTYAIMMRGCLSAGKVENAMRLFEEMKCKGFNPSTFVYLCLVIEFCKMRRFGEVGRIVEEMVEICSDLGSDFNMTSSILRELCRPVLVKEALKFGWHVANNRLRLRRVDVFCLLNVLHMQGLYSEADNLNKKLLEGGCMIDLPQRTIKCQP